MTPALAFERSIFSKNHDWNSYNCERSEPHVRVGWRNSLVYNRRAERAPHLSYSGEKSSSYIYICFLYIYIYIYIRPYVVHVPLTRALRANVGPAG